jgi:hypothetical protein
MTECISRTESWGRDSGAGPTSGPWGVERCVVLEQQTLHLAVAFPHYYLVSSQPLCLDRQPTGANLQAMFPLEDFK